MLLTRELDALICRRWCVGGIPRGAVGLGRDPSVLAHLVRFPYNVRMAPTDDVISAQLRPDVPHAARIWNYWMGGKDNFAADRAAGDAVAQVYPEIVLMAQQSRQFLIRVVRYLAAEAGIRQFLDIGTGLPTMQNTHEVAQAVAPESQDRLRGQRPAGAGARPRPDGAGGRHGPHHPCGRRLPRP